MKIDLRDKKIVIPIIIAVGAIIMVFFFYKKDDNSNVIEDKAELVSDVGSVSRGVSEQPIESKRDAYDRDIREQRNKHTAINEIVVERDDYYSEDDTYSEDEIASFERERQRKEQQNRGYVPPSPSTSNTYNSTSEDAELLELMDALKNKQTQNSNVSEEGEEQNSSYEDMRKQYLFLDSLQKANDPTLMEQEMKEKRDREIYEAVEKDKLSTLTVNKINDNSHFNSISKESTGEFIKAVIDEEVKGFAGSRVRIRLLEDVMIGNQLLKKNNYLYAIITGFGDQRVRMNIMSVMYNNKILPIKLSIYDVDGIEGMYVPSSQFREFTKQLGSTSIQGVNPNSMSSEQNQFFQSLIQQAFQSTSNAVSKAIRSNKANIKYNSHVFLIDATALAKTRKEIYEENKSNN